MDLSYRCFNVQIDEWMKFPFYKGTDDINRGDLLLYLIDDGTSEECRLATMLEF